jgi:hypothetical protein
LQTINPDLAKEWHPKKNGSLTPKDVTPNAGKKVWWQCDSGHEWKASLDSRSRGTGCPYCAGKAVCGDNCLRTINLDLARQWHPKKNGSLTPEDVTPNYGKKVWWQCDSGHEWEAKVQTRSSGRGCPHCDGEAACDDNCLHTMNPDLCKEWHPEKNGTLTPRDVAPNSHTKTWWICDKGHEWQAKVQSRNNGTGCPYCAGKAVCDDNCLETMNVVLSGQWHVKKNRTLTPRDVTANSHKKVWWQCDSGHEWEATVAHRNNGRGCPYCAGQSVCLDNCLETLNLDLATQWHSKKNGNLTPKKVTPNSSKKVWWQCDCGREWEARIADRNKGTACPDCARRKAA